MKAIREFVTDTDIVDVKGIVIEKGTKLHVIKEPKPLLNPMTQKTEQWLIVRVDNGTGDLSLMPETAFKTVFSIDDSNCQRTDG